VTAPTDEEILASHLDGDHSAFRLLVARHHRELFRFAYRLTGSGPAAEDVVQDTFVQVHLSGKTFDLSRRFKPWLFTIAANKARDHLRGRTRRREVPLDAPVGGDEERSGQRFLDLLADDAGGPFAEIADEEHRNIVRDIIQGMPDNMSEILILAYYHKLPYKEIAEVLHIPVGTVKSRLHAAVIRFGERYRARRGEPDPEGR
jgi:RNA polymerase sigma-70 factor (ECF subfamily)